MMKNEVMPHLKHGEMKWKQLKSVVNPYSTSIHLLLNHEMEEDSNSYCEVWGYIQYE